MKTSYLLHISTWMLPVLAIQWVVGARILWRNRLPIIAPALITGIYLTLADSFAIRSGIWFFDPAQNLGLKLGPYVPMEEAVFFLLTALLVSQSLVLFLPGRLRR